ncbi:MAG: hypothetical protein M0036_03535 [Desulfobacteraceae bacterium]|nr:hypothetical protein [Desulfobacteraceae bacterium]
MTHQDNGHFAAKHPKGAAAAVAIAQAVLEKSSPHGLSCLAAHQIATQLNVPPRDVGIAVDLQEIPIRQCQLGLFGHSPQSKSVRPINPVNAELSDAIKAALHNGRLSCMEAWRIADALAIPRIDVANACEALKIKINQCQLGAF